MATATKSTKQSTTVRISEQAHRSLREMAEQSGEPMQAVLDTVIEQGRRQRFLVECYAAYAALRQDPQAWGEYQKELAVWDVALMDGLEPEEAGEKDCQECGDADAAHG